MTMRPATNIYFATLWLVSFEGVCGGGLPRVWWEPGTAVEEGDTIKLQCQVASDVTGPAIWLKLDPKDANSHVLLSHGDIIITEDPRFSVLHIPKRNMYVVKIRQVSSADAGSYQCQVPVSADEEELRVEAAPPVVVTLLSDNRVESSATPNHDSNHAHYATPNHTLVLLTLLFVLTGLGR
ncbi:lachesin-like [Panulirus ornatus]|uniref:lachesin-like n=1 Tax=Panulirus ornatus TaxID=150431 RepID=UPI003A84E68E